MAAASAARPPLCSAQQPPPALHPAFQPAPSQPGRQVSSPTFMHFWVLGLTTKPAPQVVHLLFIRPMPGLHWVQPPLTARHLAQPASLHGLHTPLLSGYWPVWPSTPAAQATHLPARQAVQPAVPTAQVGLAALTCLMGLAASEPAAAGASV